MLCAWYPYPVCAPYCRAGCVARRDALSPHTLMSHAIPYKRDYMGVGYASPMRLCDTGASTRTHARVACGSAPARRAVRPSCLLPTPLLPYRLSGVLLFRFQGREAPQPVCRCA